MGQENFKSREDALKHIFECLILSPACAGSDGFINITMGKNFYRIKPVKKKQNEKDI